MKTPHKKSKYCQTKSVHFYFGKNAGLFSHFLVWIVDFLCGSKSKSAFFVCAFFGLHTLFYFMEVENNEKHDKENPFNALSGNYAFIRNACGLC